MDKSGLGLALHAKDACLITRLAFQSLPPMVSVVVGVNIRSWSVKVLLFQAQIAYVWSTSSYFEPG